MGRFCAIILFAAACGDNLVSPPGPTNPGATTDPAGGLTQQPLTVPQECGVVQWTTVLASKDTAIDLSVAANRNPGVTLLAAPIAGGSLTGFNIDERMTVVGDPNGTTIPLNDTFTAVSVSTIGSRTVSTAIDASSVQVDLLDANLGNPVAIAKLAGSAVAKPAVFQVGGTTMIPYVSAGGLSLTTFDGAWQQTGDALIGGTNEPITGLAVAPQDDLLLAAYSTADSCYIEELTTGKPGSTWQVGFACRAPRIASKSTPGVVDTKVVFEADGGVQMTDVLGTEMTGDADIVRTYAHSPRIIFDGSRYWMSFIDDRGQVIVGFVDGNDHVVTMALDGPQPQNNAYELAMVGGAPWVFTVDTNGYEAHRLCLGTVD